MCEKIHEPLLELSKRAPAQSLVEHDEKVIAEYLESVKETGQLSGGDSNWLFEFQVEQMNERLRQQAKE